MTWRVIQRGDRRWQVSIATERRPNTSGWSLVFCFRSPGQPSIWAPFPETSLSKAELYRHAERISDDRLLDLLGSAGLEPGTSGV
jgi:hypothetical protein